MNKAFWKHPVAPDLCRQGKKKLDLGALLHSIVEMQLIEGTVIERTLGTDQGCHVSHGSIMERQIESAVHKPVFLSSQTPSLSFAAVRTIDNRRTAVSRCTVWNEQAVANWSSSSCSPVISPSSTNSVARSQCCQYVDPTWTTGCKNQVPPVHTGCVRLGLTPHSSLEVTLQQCKVYTRFCLKSNVIAGTDL